MAKPKANEQDRKTTGIMMTKADLEVMTPERAVELSKQTMAQMTAQLGVPETEELCVIQWGKEAFRAGEPAMLTGKTMNTNPHVAGQPGFFAVVMYADSGPYYVDMTLPKYPHGKKPPWILDKKVYVEERAADGSTHKVYSHTERTEDRRHWLEFIPRKRCRKALKVIE